MKFDASVRELITKAYEAEKDVFLRLPLPELTTLYSDGIKTLVLFPGAYFYGPESPFSVYGEKLSCAAYFSSPDILFADVRFMSDSSFREFLTKKKYRRIAPVFAECADSGEYGCREAFSWIGEYRAEISHFCQLTPFFSSSTDEIEKFCGIFNTKDAVCIGEKAEPFVSSYKTSTALSKFYYTAAEAEKYAYRKICIYFNSRSEAAEFGRFLQKRGTAFILADGSLTTEKYRLCLKSFRDGEINILLATKSFITSGIFLSPETVLMCGMPFSVSHLSRCQTSSAFSPLKVIYCEDDIERNRKILKSFAETVGDENVYKKGLENLSGIKNFLENE